MATIDQPMPFKRLYPGPAVEGSVFTSIADMAEYLSNATRYAGQPAVLVAPGADPVSYVLNTERTAWVITGGGAVDPSLRTDLDALTTAVAAHTTTLQTKADLVGGKVPASQLPGFVDEVIEYADKAAFPATGASGTIYVSLDTGMTYRWGGTTYVSIASSIALGETASTAGRGDWTKEAYLHSQVKGNAHELTKADLGLDKVDNTADADKPVSAAVTAALTAKADLVGGSVPESQLPSYVDDVIEYPSLQDMPSQGESGKIYFALDTNLPYRWGGSVYVPMSSGLALGETAATAGRGDWTKEAYLHSQATGNTHGLTRADLGLDKVDNTTDLAKPISTATSEALANKADLVNGLILASQLPSYVDDVLEYGDISLFPAVGESGKIYISTGNSLTYRWGGTSYSLISSSLALGTTAATACRGDYGYAAYLHSLATGNQHGLTKADLALGNVDNTSDANKPISTAVATALTTKADLVGGLIPGSQLPSYVDDILEFLNLAAFPATGESGKVYVTIDTNLQYRWSGTAYVPISSSLALGTTAATATRGDWGYAAYQHSQLTGNAHSMTKADLALGNVDNTSDANKPISSATATALAAKADLVGGLIPTSQLPSYVDDVIEANTFTALPATGESGKIYVTTDTNVTYRWAGSAYTEISASLALGTTAATAFRGDYGNAAYLHSLATGNAHGLTKADLGIGNVNNTADTDKPISTAAAAALAKKADLIDGLIPASQLPSYVDDVLEYASFGAFPATGESGKIYVATDTNLVYRWAGSSYTAMSSTLALGETASTAFRGDYGKAAYDHSLVVGNAHGLTKADLSLGNVDNTSDANKPISTAVATALTAKADLVGGLVPANQLPSYVDDVIEKSSFAALPATGETGKIYVTTDTNVTYRWSGTDYVEISASLALGITAATAFRGDWGNAAYQHSLATGNVHSIPVATTAADGLMSKEAMTKLGGTTLAATVDTLPALASRVANVIYIVTVGDASYAAGSYFWDGATAWPIGSAGQTVGLSCTIVNSLTAVSAAGSDGMFLVSSSSDADGIYLKVNSSIYCMSGMRGDKGEKGDTGATTWAGITDKPTTFTPDTHSHVTTDITGLAGLIIALS